MQKNLLYMLEIVLSADGIYMTDDEFSFLSAENSTSKHSTTEYIIVQKL